MQNYIGQPTILFALVVVEQLSSFQILIFPYLAELAGGGLLLKLRECISFSPV